VTLLLALLYPIAIQYERGGWWLLVTPITVVAMLIDVAANWTELSLALWEWPKPYEYTFSDRLSRLIHEQGWRSDIARFVSRILNYIAPSGKHIQ
jgi:hypothetical protein